jgi:hypothetical protein
VINWRHLQRLAASVILSTVALWSCTTFIEETTCERGKTACGGIHDARFCEYVAVAVEGADCTALGIVESKQFCVVTSTACIDTHYAVKNGDCRVVRYEKVRDSARAECSSGAPTFVNR